MGWLTVSAYFVTAIACFRAMRARERDKIFWGLLFVVTAFLCVNKQLDLQTALTATGRCAARLQGWYDDRRTVQTAFILGIATLSLLMLFVSFVYLFRSLPRVGVAFVGLGFLLTFVVIRSLSFHHFDALIGSTILGAKVNWILELSGIALILVNALVAFQRRPTRRILSDGRSAPREAV
ncbi:isopropylmalate isomerase [Pseudooceanicola onchidii]|uniref:isopropylmalate isomerase n=1 Tax=Pseudooceanicola onchidii TaxID=2562279 RepID=UPI001981AB87|nr:isopropylmalate isomerase [Pseudooceanicola onchidii]